MKQSFKDMAQRGLDAERKFRECVMRVTGCDNDTAEKVSALYIKERILKIDHVTGQWTVKHGAFLDTDTLKNAVDIVNQ